MERLNKRALDFSRINDFMRGANPRPHGVASYGNLAQSVEQSPVKRTVIGSSPIFPAMQVSYRGSTSACHADSTGSIPVTCSYVALDQWLKSFPFQGEDRGFEPHMRCLCWVISMVEGLPCKQDVKSSSLLLSSNSGTVFADQ